MRYEGKSYAGQLPREYSIIRFFVGKDTIWFHSGDNLKFIKDEIIPVRYQKDFPSDARVNTFAGLWLDTLIYMSPLVLILLISYLHPDLVPRKSRIWLFAKRPFIQIVY